ncbi:MAG: hypothetical protein F4X34_01265 [Chloroflexi bacterium]|nr:hypothetical protein [Chloroflexota bacterium]
MEVSVDTYIGRRNTSRYHSFVQEGVEILISETLAPYVEDIKIDCKKFLFINRMRALLELNNGYVISA